MSVGTKIRSAARAARDWVMGAPIRFAAGFGTCAVIWFIVSRF